MLIVKVSRTMKINYLTLFSLSSIRGSLLIIRIDFTIEDNTLIIINSIIIN